MIDVKKKVGPFPLYVWLGAGTVAVLALYIRMRNNSQGTADQVAGTVVASPPTIDPTTGLPYAGGGGGGSSVDVPTNSYDPPGPAEPNLADVLGLIGTLQDYGFFQQSSAPDSGYAELLAAFQGFTGQFANPSQSANHSSPPAVGKRKIIQKPSAAHGGQLWNYYKGQSGKLIPVGKASSAKSSGGAAPTVSSKPVPSKAAPKTTNTAAGGGVYSGPARKIIQKPSAAHGGKLWNYYKGASGQLIPVGPASGK